MNTINTLNGVILASRDEVIEHAENTTVHLTEEERTAWNAKADASQLVTKADAATFTAHETNTTVHVSQEEKEKWNARNTKGVVAATQDGLDEHIQNMAVHVTDAERTAWNSAAAIPEASTAYTGDNTHDGAETFSGPVTMNGPVVSDTLETERMLGKAISCSCLPLVSDFNAMVKQGWPMGFNIVRPSGGTPVKVAGGERNPWRWWSKDKIVMQVNFAADNNAIFEVGSCSFIRPTKPLEDHYAYAHTIIQTGNAGGINISLQIDGAMKKFRLKYHSHLSNYAVAPGVMSVYEWDMPEEFNNVKMTRIIYAYHARNLDVYYITASGELKLIAATPATQGYAITDAQILFHGNTEVFSALAHVEDKKLMNWLDNQPLPYSRSKWVERNSDAPLSGIELSAEGASSSLTLNAEAGCAWTLVSKPDWLDVGAENWENGAVVTVSAGATEETRHGSLILGTDGNHAVAGVKAYEKVVITQAVEA